HAVASNTALLDLSGDLPRTDPDKGIGSGPPSFFAPVPTGVGQPDLEVLVGCQDQRWFLFVMGPDLFQTSPVFLHCTGKEGPVGTVADLDGNGSSSFIVAAGTSIEVLDFPALDHTRAPIIRQEIPVSDEPRAILFADVDGDGSGDLVVDLPPDI